MDEMSAGLKEVGQQESPPRRLADFLRSPEWQTILLLLDEKDESIRVAESPVVCGYVTYVFINEFGFHLWAGKLESDSPRTTCLRFLPNPADILAEIWECDSGISESGLVETILAALENLQESATTDCEDQYGTLGLA